MRHDFHVPGHAFRIRPVASSDASYIVDLRARSAVFLNRGAANADEQLTWLERYFDRPGDYYFVVETIEGKRREGLIALYDVRWPDATAEWGRWVLEEGSNAAVESALLVYRFAFDRLRLASVRCRTLAANAKVIAFHDSCGLIRSRDSSMLEHNGRPCPAVEHSLSISEWPRVMSRLDALASRFAARATDALRKAEALR
jgi:RimJ/RimL family protein N-acetyltransferase